MADRKRELDKIDALYQWIAHDLQRIRGELLKEMRYSTVQVGSLYQEMKADKDKSTSAIAQEIAAVVSQSPSIDIVVLTQSSKLVDIKKQYIA